MSDLIDRQAAIDAIQAHKHNVLDAREYDEGVAYGYAAAHNHICDVIAILPSAQPEPKRGRWHYSDGKPATIGLSFGVICDQCGTESEYCTNFCGECGADMRQKGENSESN